MAIPTWLYYKQKVRKTIFSSTPTNELDVDRLIANEPAYWIEKSEVSGSSEPKTLIITDWSLQTLDVKNKNFFIRLLQNLYSEGFKKIYVLKGDDIVECPPDMTELSFEKMTPTAPSIITKKMASKGIASDHCVVLDYFNTRRLAIEMGKIIFPHAKIDTIALADYLDTQNITEILREKSPLIISATSPSTKDIQHLTSIIKDRPDIKLSLTLRNPDNFDTLLTLKDNISELYLSSSSINGKTLVAILSKTLNLQKLGLRSCKNLNEVFSAKEVLASLDYLTELYLSGSDINGKTLAALLKHVPNLQTLELSYCKNLNEVFSDKEVFASLDYLTELYVLGSKINGKSLAVLLKHAPNLQKLNLSYYNNLNEVFVDEDEKVLASLAHLTELNLSGSDINGKTLAILLKYAPKLQKLDLGSCHNLNKEFPESNLASLAYLTELYLLDSNINRETLAALLRQMPNLKIIRIKTRTVTPPFLNENGELSAALSNTLTGQSTGAQYGNQQPSVVNSTTISSTKDCSVGCNTNNPETTLTVKQFFTGITGNEPTIDPRHYRLNVYSKINASTTTRDVILEQGELALEDCKIPLLNSIFLDPAIKSRDDSVGLQQTQSGKTENHHHYLGQISQTLQAGEWIPLPSISSQEKMIGLCATSPDNVDAKFELKYSKQHHLYYFKSDKKVTINIQYLVGIPHPLPKIENQIAEGSLLASCIRDFKKFEKKDLILPPNATGKEILEAMLSQKTGSCEQRSSAFLYYANQMKNDLGIHDIRLVTNGCHAFVEIQLKSEGEWFPIDLGGYPAKVEIIEPENFESITSLPDQKPEEQLSPPKDYFATWERKKSEESVEERTTGLLLKKQKRLLLSFSSEYDIENYALYLQQRIKGCPRPVYMIHSPEELRCLSAALYLNKDNTGEIKPAPAGPLHDFLTSEHKTSPVIIVNWANFTPDDLVRYNSIIDSNPNADGTSLPDNTLIIGLYHDHPGAYRDGDFMGRQDEKEDLSDRSDEITTLATPLKKETIQREPSETDFVIDLFHSSNWKSLLLGSWQLQGEELKFQPGPLIVALGQKAKHIHLKNAPWELPEFQHFWDDIKRENGFSLYGRWIAVLNDVDISQSEGYDWKWLTQTNMPDMTGTTNRYILNPSTLSHCLGEYHLYDKQLYSQPGWLAKATKSSLLFYVTRNLTLDQWARFLTEAKKYHVNIRLQCAPNVNLPQEMQSLVWNEEPRALSSSTTTLTDDAHVILSDNEDATVQQLSQQLSTCKIVTISELEPTDLFYKIDAKMAGTQFEFNEKIGDVWQALQNGKTVILKGKISPAMADQLASLCETPGYLWHNGKPVYFKGQLLIVTDEKNLQFAKSRVHHSASLETKPKKSSEDPITLLSHPVTFESHRKQSVLDALTHSPSLIITGKTGVGKSTFMQQLQKDSDVTVFMGEDKIENWAKQADSGKPIILFIDEANLEQTDWSMFEDLYNENPSIYYRGKYYPLSSHHKVIFAGNPKSYGGERRVPEFFIRHPNEVEFLALSKQSLIKDVVMPIIQAAHIKDIQENTQKDINKILIDVYQYIENLPSQKVLITPRELQMMALTFIALLPKAKPEDYQMLARYSAYSIASAVLDETQKEKFETWFNQEFTINGKELLDNPPIERTYQTKSDFYLTLSHKRPYHLLMDSLAVREYKQHAKEHDIQGGLNLLILEGAPGIGKSHFVISMLVEQGFSECKHVENKEELPKKKSEANRKRFYHLPVSAPFSKKEALLLQAFHEGAIVIVDEINSSVMMERLLNTLLMGTDLKNHPADNPGFMIIGTQNPIHMAGRQSASQALQRRAIHCDFPEYTRNEMIEVLQHKGVKDGAAVTLVDDYLYAVKYARKYHHSPEPTFRDLLRQAKPLSQHSEAKKEKPNHQNHWPSNSTFFHKPDVEETQYFPKNKTLHM